MISHSDKKYFKKYSPDKGYQSQKNNPKFIKRLAEIKILGKQKGKLLDIGCAYGYFLDKAKKAGFSTYGIEISPYAVSKISHLHRIKNFNASREKFPFKKNFFDVITLDHCLEHIQNPIFTLKEINRVLKSKGLLFIEVPIRTRWAGEPTHISYFDELSLKFILENLDFKILNMGEEGGKFRNILGIIRLILKGNTYFNFVPKKTGSFLICYAQKK